MHEQINVNDFFINKSGTAKLSKVVIENMKSINVCSEIDYCSNSYTNKTLLDKIVVNWDYKLFLSANHNILANYDSLINYKYTKFKRMKEITLWYYNDNIIKALEQIK